VMTNPPSNTSNEVKTTVSDVLDEYMSEAWREGHNEQPYSEVEYWKAECLATIEKLLLEVIGEDIGYSSATPDTLIEARDAQNRLKKHQRNTLKAVLYGEGK